MIAGDIMRYARCFVIVMASLFYVSASQAQCRAMDYQELKEMSDQDFQTYACKVKKDMRSAVLVLSATQQIVDLKDKFRQIDGRAPDPNNNAIAEAKSLEICKSEWDRVERLARTRQPNQSLDTMTESCK
jgi:hypothetical protein